MPIKFDPLSNLHGAASGLFDDLTSIRAFVRVVEVGSYSEVARRVGVTPATISKHIAALEGCLGQRLINRTTRKLFATEAGQLLYEHCTRALLELEQAANGLLDLQDRPTGHLRVTVPLLLGMRLIAPRLPDFLKLYPALSLDVNFSVDKIDLFDERIDVAVRISDAIDPGLVAIKVAPYRRVFCAAPKYLEQHGIPRTPDDLLHHNCLLSRSLTGKGDWPIRRDGLITPLRVRGTFASDNGEAIFLAAVAGIGVSMTARWLVQKYLRSGELVELLPEYTPDNRAVYAVLLQRSASSRKLTSFIDFLKESLADLA